MKIKEGDSVKIDGEVFTIIRWKDGNITTKRGYYEGHYAIENGKARMGKTLFDIEIV